MGRGADSWAWGFSTSWAGGNICCQLQMSRIQLPTHSGEFLKKHKQHHTLVAGVKMQCALLSVFLDWTVRFKCALCVLGKHPSDVLSKTDRTCFPEEAEGRECHKVHTDGLALHQQNTVLVSTNCASRTREWTDLELLLKLTIEAFQHHVGFLVLTDRHLDFPFLSGQQPETRSSQFISFQTPFLAR